MIGCYAFSFSRTIRKMGILWNTLLKSNCHALLTVKQQRKKLSPKKLVEFPRIIHLLSERTEIQPSAQWLCYQQCRFQEEQRCSINNTLSHMFPCKRTWGFILETGLRSHLGCFIRIFHSNYLNYCPIKNIYTTTIELYVFIKIYIINWLTSVI